MDKAPKINLLNGQIPLRVFGARGWLERVIFAASDATPMELVAGSAGIVPGFAHRISCADGSHLMGARIGAVYYTDYLDFADIEQISEESLAELFKFARFENLEYLLFSNVPRGTKFHQALSAQSKDVTALPCQSTLGVDTSNGRAQWWGSRSRNSRQRYNKVMRGLSRAGAEFSIDMASREGLEQFLHLQSMRAIQAGLDAFKSDLVFRKLILSLTDWPKSYILSLRIGGTCRAALLLLQEADSVGIYAQGFDPAIEDLSPGLGLFGYLLEEGFAGRWAYVDFLRGEEPYKLHWASQRVEMDKFLWLAPDTPSHAIGFFQALIE